MTVDPLAEPTRIALAGDCFRREHLAWAAGIFDGEGHIGFDRRRNRAYLEVTQSGTSGHVMLDRLRAATGMGVIRGPYASTGNRQPIWRYAVGTQDQITEFVGALWPWLDLEKRAQASSALAQRRPTDHRSTSDAPLRTAEVARNMREQLAWIAGVFDGEGHLGLKPRESGAYLEIAQAGDQCPSLLLRVRECVGFGSIDGPYRHSRVRPIWRYRLGSFERIQAFIAMTWPWLGIVKRDQAVDVLGSWRAAKARRIAARRSMTTCINHHPLDPARVDPITGKRKPCRACGGAAEARYRARCQQAKLGAAA